MLSPETKLGLLVGLGFIVVFAMLHPTVGVVEHTTAQPEAPISTPASPPENSAWLIQLLGLLRWLTDEVGENRELRNEQDQ